MDYLVSGMISMLRHGVANTDMTFSDVQDVCDEPDLHELEDMTLAEMQDKWETAKSVYLAEQATL